MTERLSVASAGRRASVRPYLIAALLALSTLGTLAVARWGYPGEFLGSSATSAWGADDAYITFRYAHEVIAGAGAVWNVGERVEGYSSPGFLALLLPAAALGDRWLFPMAVGWGIVGLAACIAWAFAYAESWPLALCVAVWPLGWLWAASGLETGLVMACQLGMALGARRVVQGGRGQWLCWACALSCVVLRADGFVWPILLAGWLFLQGASGRRMAFRVLLVVVLGVALFTAWRLAYYGDWLPNTARAKVTGDWRNALRWASFDVLAFMTSGGIVLLPMLSAVWQGVSLRVPRPGLEVWMTTGWLAYFFVVGGDVYGERWLVVLMPLAMAWLLRQGGSKWRWVAVAVALTCQAMPLVTDWRFHPQGTKRDVLLEAGERLASLDVSPDDVLAIDAAGKIPFAARMRSLDMLGLNDRHIASGPALDGYVGHQKFDADYVLTRRPRFIVGLAERHDDTLDLSLGLSRVRYLTAGYEVAFLIWDGLTGLPADAIDMLDVRGWPAERVLQQVQKGYGRLILELRR